MFKVCMIGCGVHAALVYGPSLRQYAEQHPDMQLAACCDPNIEAGEHFKQNFGFAEHFTDWKTATAQIKFDAVLLVVPIASTCKIGVALLRQGTPLLLEKPPGANPAETLQLISAQQEAKTPHRVAFNRRYMPQMQALRRILDCAGNISFVEYKILRHKRFEEDFSGTAIHAIDAVRFITGDDYRCLRFKYQPISGHKAVNIFIAGQTLGGCEVHINILPGAGGISESVIAAWENQHISAQFPTGAHQPVPLQLVHFHGQGAQDVCTPESLGSSPDFYNTGGFYGGISSFLDALYAGRNDALQSDLSSSLQSVAVADCVRHRVEEYCI